MTEEEKTDNKYARSDISSKQYLYDRLAEIQKNLKAPKTKKHFQGWKHRSAEDILNAVKPLLDGESIILSDEIVSVFPPFVYEKTEKNTKTNSVLSGIYIKSTATLSNGDHSISAFSCVKESTDKAGLDDPQISGIATSYARKYALCGLLGIDGSDDADEHNDYEHRSQVEKQQKSQPIQPTPQYKAELPVNDVETNAIKIVMNQIHEYCSKMTSDEKREALKKASSYTNPQTQKTTYIDDINNLTINGNIPSVARLNITYKNIRKFK
jgi:hypothetical protein